LQKKFRKMRKNFTNLFSNFEKFHCIIIFMKFVLSRFTLQRPVVHLDVSTLQGPKLHLDLSGLVWTTGACAAPGHIHTTGA
jgi:hypothetical protein